MDKILLKFTSKQAFRDFQAKYALEAEIKIQVGDASATYVVAGFEVHHGAPQVHMTAKKGEG